MGFARGSELVRKVADRVIEVVEDPETKRYVFDALVEAAVDLDCDTLDECRGIDPLLDECIDFHWGSDEDDDG